MKKRLYILTIMAAVLAMAGVSVAETVDIGLGRMDRAEFEALRQMVRGESGTARFSASPPPEKGYVAEMAVGDLEAIRQAMAPDRNEKPAVAVATGGGMVDIGGDATSNAGFCDLTMLVATSYVQRQPGTICP